MYPKMTKDMKNGLLPMTTLVRSDLAIDTGQLTAKQSRKRTSQMLKSPENRCTISLFFSSGKDTLFLYFATSVWKNVTNDLDVHKHIKPTD